MHFQDNVLKEYLKNVYFITGTPCGGKTTISRALGQKYGLMVYDADQEFSRHQQLSDPIHQPAMNRKFRNADEFFGRTVEDYSKWLTDNTREQLDYILMDLIQRAQDQPVLCDLHLTVDEADRLTEADRIVFLIKDPENIISDYCDRPDHDGFNRFINSASNPEQAKRTCNATLEHLNRRRYEQIRQSRYFWIERTAQSTVEDTMQRVARHFCL